MQENMQAGFMSGEPTFIARVSAQSERLSDADRKLVELLSAPGYETLFLSAGRLCERVGVHEAAATRLAQKLGYGGYPSLRDALQKEHVERENGAKRMRRSLETIGRGDYLQRHIASEILALQRINEYISQDKIDLAADKIYKSGKKFIFFQGHAESVAVYLKKRLDRFGFTNIFLTGRGHEIAEHSSGINQDDVVIAFAFRRVPTGFTSLIDFAKKRDAFTICITDIQASMMKSLPNLILVAPRDGTKNEFQTPAVPLAIVSSILLTLVGRNEEVMIERLEKLAELFDNFDEKKEVS